MPVCSIAFIRMRSPSSAPPDLRREGSMETIANFSASRWSMRNRRTSSSVSELFPAPPVPVMPRVGTVAFAALASSSSRSFVGTAPTSSPVMSRDSARVRANRSPSVKAWSDFGSSCARSVSAAATISLIMPCSPSFCPSSGEKMRVTP
jgi:hypothetical protein